MEYVPGQDLNTVVMRSGPLPVVNACYYAQQVAVGLQYAFEKGMIHRDIKPGNLILFRDGKKHVVKILDFGLVKAMAGQGGDGDHLTMTAQGMGTPAYMAPEQAKGAARADVRADVYSLGCTLYHLLAGRPPFTGTSPYDGVEAHRTKPAAPLNEVRQDVPPDLAAVVAKLLAKDPAQRYQEPGEVAQALKSFVKAVAKPIPAVSPPVPPLLRVAKNEGPNEAAKAVAIPRTVIEQQGIADRTAGPPQRKTPEEHDSSGPGRKPLTTPKGSLSALVLGLVLCVLGLLLLCAGSSMGVNQGGAYAVPFIMIAGAVLAGGLLVLAARRDREKQQAEKAGEPDNVEEVRGPKR